MTVETISYQYDALKRLTQAQSVPSGGNPNPGWTEAFGYDGFGNMLSKTLNGGSNQVVGGVNSATNQLSSATYDLNGNMSSGAGASIAYDTSNRMVSAQETSGGIEYYGYGPDNKRVYRLDASGHETWMFYGPSGQLMGKYTLDSSGNFWPVELDIWFGGRLVATQTVTGTNTRTTNPVMQDRLGTNWANSARFYPYGDEISSSANDREKFATYTRDSYTGLDYADQRYYASSYGRFNTVDPLRRSARSDRPLTWDRFVYCEDDPVNCSDPTGLIDWGRVTLGGVQLVGGVSGGIFLGLTVPGTLFGSLPLVIPGAIAAGGAIAIGAGNIMAGLTASGSTVSPSTVQGMSSASDLSNAGGLVCGAVTGGNSAAIQACSAAANTVSFAVDAASVANTSSIGEAAAGAVALINDVGAAVPGPVVLPGTSITVADTVGSLPVYTSEVGSNLTFDGDGVSNLDVL